MTQADLRATTENQLERRMRFTLPAIMLTMICGGFAVAGLWPPEEIAQDPYLSWLVSPVFVGLCLVAALGFAAVALTGFRADNRLRQITRARREQDRKTIQRRLGGEAFARQWSVRPRIRNRVRELRRQRGIELEDLATLLDYGPGTLALLEKAHYPPDLGTALMLSDLFGVPVDELFWAEEAPDTDDSST